MPSCQETRRSQEGLITSSLRIPPLVVGDIALEPGSHGARLNGTLVRFTRKELELLQYFMAHPGRVLPRLRLLSSVWGDETSYGLRTVDVYIRRLRVKLVASTRCRIETVVNVGYKLVVGNGAA